MQINIYVSNEVTIILIFMPDIINKEQWIQNPLIHLELEI